MVSNFKNATLQFETNDEILGLTVGNSMLPLFRSNKDIAVVEKINRKLKVNDVLLYRKSGTEDLILHRLIKITDNGFVIRGDNCYNREINVKPEDILGILKAFKRNDKYYECDKSNAYKFYVFYIRASYPLRRVIHKFRSFVKVVRRKIRKIKKRW